MIAISRFSRDKNYLLSPGIEPTISISRDSHIDHSSNLAQVIVGISCIYVWTTTALKDWLYFPTIKIRPVVHEKQFSGSQIRISIRITPNFELGLPMIITSLLTKSHQNPTSRFWEILLTNKQTNRQTDTRRWLQYPAFRGIINRQTKNFGHTEFRTLDPRVFGTMLLPTEV